VGINFSRLHPSHRLAQGPRGVRRKLPQSDWNGTSPKLIRLTIDLIIIWIWLHLAASGAEIYSRDPVPTF